MEPFDFKSMVTIVNEQKLFNKTVNEILQTLDTAKNTLFKWKCNPNKRKKFITTYTSDEDWFLEYSI